MAGLDGKFFGTADAVTPENVRARETAGAELRSLLSSGGDQAKLEEGVDNYVNRFGLAAARDVIGRGDGAQTGVSPQPIRDMTVEEIQRLNAYDKALEDGTGEPVEVGNAFEKYLVYPDGRITHTNGDDIGGMYPGGRRGSLREYLYEQLGAPDPLDPDGFRASRVREPAAQTGVSPQPNTRVPRISPAESRPPTADAGLSPYATLMNAGRATGPAGSPMPRISPAGGIDSLPVTASPGGIDSLPVTAAPRTSPDVNPRHLSPEERRDRLGPPMSFGMVLPSQPPPRTSVDIDRDIVDATRAAERDPTGATFDRLRSLAAERDAQHDTPPEVFVNRWNGERDVFAEEGPGAAGAVFDAADPEAGPTLATPDATTPTGPSAPAGPSGGGSGGSGGSGGIAGVAAPATAGGALSTYDQMLTDALAENESDRAQAKWLLLAEIGAGMLGSTAPGFAGTGQAISAGLGSYTDAKDALKAEAMGIAGLAEDQRRYEQNRADQFALGSMSGSGSGAPTGRGLPTAPMVGQLQDRLDYVNTVLAGYGEPPELTRWQRFTGVTPNDPFATARLNAAAEATRIENELRRLYAPLDGTTPTTPTGEPPIDAQAP